MPIGTPTDRGSATSTTTAATTGSFTVTSGDRIYAAVGIRRTITTAPTDVMAVTDSQGLTWTKIGTTAQDGGGGGDQGVRVWLYVATSNGNSMTVTDTYSGAGSVAHNRLSVFSVSGASTDVTNFATAVSTTGDPSVTLAALQSGSIVVGAAMMSFSGDITPPTGYTELAEVGASTHDVETVYDDTSPSTTLTWSTAGGASAAIAVEVKSSAITGTASITEAGDTLASAAAIATAAAAAITEAGDTLSSSAALAIVGSAAITEADDTLASVAVILSPIAGTASITEADDTLVSAAIRRSRDSEVRTIEVPGMVRIIVVPASGLATRPDIALRTVAVPLMRRTIMADASPSRSAVVPPQSRRLVA